MKRSRAFLFVLMSCVVITPQAEIYKWTDENGKVHYSDNAPENQASQTVQVAEINTFTNVTISDTPGWQGFFQPPANTAPDTVVIYTTRRCGFCRKAKQYFAAHDIAYTERKVDEDREAYDEFEALGASGVPVILLGEKRMNGFNADAFAALYASAQLEKQARAKQQDHNHRKASSQGK